jgi:hypothetical protein
MKKLILGTVLTTFTFSNLQASCTQNYKDKIKDLQDKMIFELGANDGKGRSIGRGIINTAGLALVGAGTGAGAGAVAAPVAAFGVMAASGIVMASPSLAGIGLGIAPAIAYAAGADVDEDGAVLIFGLGIIGGIAGQATLSKALVPATKAVFSAAGSTLAATPVVMMIGAGVGAATGIALGTYDSILAVKMKRLYEASELIRLANGESVLEFEKIYRTLGKKINKNYTSIELKEMIQIADQKNELCSSYDHTLDIKDIKKLLKKKHFDSIQNAELSEVTEENLQDELNDEFEDGKLF